MVAISNGVEINDVGTDEAEIARVLDLFLRSCLLFFDGAVPAASSLTLTLVLP